MWGGKLCERLTDKETSATANSLRRRLFGGGSRETEQRVVRWGTVSKFSKGRRGFNPSFGKAEKIRRVRVNKVWYTNIAESLTQLLFADCKRKLRNTKRLLARSTNYLQSGLLGFVKPVSDLSNRLRETGKSRICLCLVWQIDYALSQRQKDSTGSVDNNNNNNKRSK